MAKQSPGLVLQKNKVGGGENDALGASRQAQAEVVGGWVGS